jgi:hypothetical protein
MNDQPDKILDKLLAGLLGKGIGEKDDDDTDDLPSASEQKAVLESILNQDLSKHVVGAYVERNKAGKKRYKWPREGEVGMITTVLDKPIVDRSEGQMDFMHGQIAVCKMQGGKLHVATSFVDFRYYKVVSHAPKGNSDED